MAMTRISDVIYPGMVRPGRVELYDVLDDAAAPVPLSPFEAEPVQPSINDLLRNALAIDEQLSKATSGIELSWRSGCAER